MRWYYHRLLSKRCLQTKCVDFKHLLSPCWLIGFWYILTRDLLRYFFLILYLAIQIISGKIFTFSAKTEKDKKKKKII